MVSVVRKRIRVGKTHKWGRGRASDSNPGTTHHRDAISQFRRSKTDNSFKLLVNDDSNSCMSSIHTATTAQTFHTWATNWTGCTNSAFSNIFKLGQFNPQLHKQILAVLATAVKLLEKDERGESTVEYFGVLTKILLNSQYSDNLGAVLYCLKVIIRSIPSTLLCLKYEVLTDMYVKAVEENGSDMLVVNSALECLGFCLKAVPVDEWHFPPKHFLFFISFCIHNNAKIRKKIRKLVSMLIPDLEDSKIVDHLGKFLVDSLNKNISEANNKETLYLLAFAAEFVAHVNQSLYPLMDMLIKLLMLNISKISLAVVKLLHIYFKSQKRLLSCHTLNNYLKVLCQFRPNNSDTVHVFPFLQMFTAGCKFSFFLNSLTYVDIYDDAMDFLYDGLSGGRDLANKSLEGILESFSKLRYIWDMGNLDHDILHLNVMGLINRTEEYLIVQYKDNFDVIFRIFDSIFSTFGSICPDLLYSSLSKLANLRESEGFELGESLEKAICSAVTFMGPDYVLRAIPLDLNPDDRMDKFTRSWMLPLLAKSVKNADLGHFVDYFLPLVDKISHNASILKDIGRVVEAKTLFTVWEQIWNILPGYCDGAKNLSNNIECVARRINDLCLCESLLLRVALKSIRKLCNLHCRMDGELLSKYMPTFVSFCINQLVSGDSVKSGALRAEYVSTINESLAFCDKKNIGSVVSMVTDKIDLLAGNLENRETNTSLRGFLSVLRILTNYLSDEDMYKTLRCIVSMLEGNVDSGIQKSAYNLLADFLVDFDRFRCICPNLDDFMKFLFEKSSNCCSSPAKYGRFRCLLVVSRRVGSFSMEIFNSLITEGVIGVGEVGRKAREGALQLINGAFQFIQRTVGKSPTEAVDIIISKLMVGLVGSAGIVCKSLVVLKSLISSHADSFSEETMTLCVENGIQLLSHSDSSVMVETLGYLHSIFVFFDDQVVCKHVYKMIPAVMAVAGLDASSKVRIKRKRILTKAYKLVGLEVLKKLVPEDFHKVLSNIAKSCRSTTKSSKEDDAVTCCGHDMPPMTGEISDSDDETVGTRRSKGVRIMKTGHVVDLADPSEIGRSITCAPVAKKRKRDNIPVTADGKIVVLNAVDEMEDSFERSEEVEFKKPKKEKFKGNPRGKKFSGKGQRRGNRITLPASQRRARKRHGH